MEYDQSPWKYPGQEQDIRDRLAHATCEDELIPNECLEYQEYLEYVFERRQRYQYALKASSSTTPDAEPDAEVEQTEQALERACDELTAYQYLPKTRLQQIRTHFLRGEQYRRQDRRNGSGDPTGLRIDPLGRAAQQFRQGAQLARQIEEWALVSELSHLASGAAMGSEPYRKRFHDAYTDALEAVNAWRKLPDRDVTSDLAHLYSLADELAIRAQVVGEERDAVEALEQAAAALHRLRQHDDFTPEADANSTLFLEWDWAALYSSLGYSRRAFRQIVRAHKSSGKYTKSINVVRLARVIAEFALNVIAYEEPSDYSRERLFKVAEQQIRFARALMLTHGDTGGYGLTLLVEARFYALRGIKDVEERTGLLQDALVVARARNDRVLSAQVDIGYGEEHISQGRYAEARECFKKAEKEMLNIGCVEFARHARRMIERLPIDHSDADEEGNVV